MKITEVLVREMVAVSFRSACDISRAWRPTCASPMSPSISARGTSAATESTTITSTAFERTSASQISSACSPVSGWLTSRSSRRIAEVACVAGVEGVLDVDVRSGAARLLRFSHDVLGQRALAGRFRTEDLGHPAARDAADAQCDVQRQRARRDRLDRGGVSFAEPNDRPAAELLLDLREREFQRPSAVRFSH